MERKYSAILGNLGNTCDRFLSSGYKDQPSKPEMMKKAASIPDVMGIELVGTWDITRDNLQEMQEMLEEHHLQCSSIIPDHFSQKIWGKGAFTSRDADIRKKAVEATMEAMDMAEYLGCPLVNVWPGQDGYDYPLQGDFEKAYQWLVDAFRICADHNPGIKLALEYKMKEPRTHSYLATASNTLLICEEISRDNVGVCIDFGHALQVLG
jgi:sugar phosphate isomerase/epimerase